MRILVIEPERRPEAREIEGSLKSMQEIVGGLIQPIYLDDSVVLICNDEGKLINLPANRGLRGKDGQIYDVVFGTFFLCGAPADSDHFTGLTPEQIERYGKQFHTPEMFWGMDGQRLTVSRGLSRLCPPIGGNGSLSLALSASPGWSLTLFR